MQECPTDFGIDLNTLAKDATFPLDYLKMMAGQQAFQISRLVSEVAALVRKTNTVASKWKRVEKLKSLWAQTKMQTRKKSSRSVPAPQI